jgi:HPt (histidine-containing phosphotransfer) domain-containing protein
MSSDLAVLDVDTVLENFDGDLEFYDELLGDFEDVREEMIADVEKSVASGEADKIVFAAHTLKGCLRNIGALASGQVAEEMEHAARKEELGNMDALFESLSCELARLQEGIRQFKKKNNLV